MDLEWWRRLRAALTPSRPSLLTDAHDTAEAVDWTPIRDVMQVRRRTKLWQRRIFMQCLACTGFLVLFFLTLIAGRLLLLWWSGIGT